MSFTKDKRRRVYDRSSGYCHICHKKLAWKNYREIEARGAWEIEHSNPKARGGTDALNNLYPACIPCNHSKRTKSTRSARAVYGKTRAPLTREKREKAKMLNSVMYGLGGAVIARMLWPPATLFAGLICMIIGQKRNPDK